jgi:hypothetical protein
MRQLTGSSLQLPSAGVAPPLAKPTEYHTMNSQMSRKIIVAGGMAVAVGIAVAIFALRSHPVTPIAQTPRPPAPVAQIPTAAPAAVAQVPDAPAAVPEVPSR